MVFFLIFQISADLLNLVSNVMNINSSTLAAANRQKKSTEKYVFTMIYGLGIGFKYCILFFLARNTLVVIILQTILIQLF